MISIGSRREVLWDDYLIDTEKTTAELRAGTPIAREPLGIVFDEPWEGDGCLYHTIIQDGDLFRMYYLAYNRFDPITLKVKWSGTRVCYAESRDGIHWEKPALGLCEFQNSRNNNIILSEACTFDNFFVFKDENPACPPDRLYKGVGAGMWKSAENRRVLMCLPSADGVRFRVEDAFMITDKGHFDSLNTIHWYPEFGKYIGFIRGFHTPGHDQLIGTDWNPAIRDIRRIESEDFVNWTEPELLDFGEAEDYPLYTNNIMNYYRAPHMRIGFPTRYVERREWTPNFDELCGRELRLARMREMEPREGLAVTDCVFMFSRDLKRWTRLDESLVRPGPEHPKNWLYGDAYPVYGLYEMPSAFTGADKEMVLLVPENHLTGYPKTVRRYTLRRDGFLFRHAGYRPRTLVTRELTFTGSEMFINFSTSARGYLTVTLRDRDGAELRSCETFGDSTHRRVRFDGDLSAFSGKPVVITFTMSDADIYSMKFE